MTTMPKTVTLRSSDAEAFVVDRRAAEISVTISAALEDDDTGDVTLANVAAPVLSKVLEYCNAHVDASKSAEQLGSFDTDFLRVDQGMLFELIMAANYLNIKPLLEMTCMHVADMIKGKTPEEIRRTFNIKADFTAEEEREVREENAWAFEVVSCPPVSMRV